MERLNRGEVVQFSSPEELPAEAEMDRLNFLKLGYSSQVAVPIAVGGAIVGAIAIDTTSGERQWPQELIQRLRRLGEIFANAVVRKEKELEIRSAFSEIKILKEQLEADYTYLREEIDLTFDFHKMIGQSEPIRQVIQKINRIALTDVTVLVLGETGTGKELIARAIHAASQRRDRPMVKVNCAALPANLIESELFGHEKGAFTSAQARQVGRFELAHGNTLFLDEVGELPIESQAKLLRVLQEGEFERLGSSRTIKVDVRIIAATNRDLEEEVRRGRFRQDLWYRLNVFPLTAPPLRHRREDIPLLANWFVSKFGRKQGKSIKRIPADVLQSLQAYPWPGNVRELENVIERAVINTQGGALQLLDHLDPPRSPERAPALISTLEETERNHIIQVLTETKWRIDGPKGAAMILGLNPSTLRFRIRKLGIQRSSSVE
ncbi:MAG: sigma 54-interacting transcriptional regulator [Desulfuromonadales bacterium]|nr:sigma 54-interacting transcriptional regulator [Desulfuromonadales bacterium]